VFEENLEAQRRKCLFRKHADAIAAQPYYSKGINSDGGEAGVGVVTSAAKRAFMHKFSEQEFWGLVPKIRQGTRRWPSKCVSHTSVKLHATSG
jgi:tRNA:m4X modification enzyme